jgi:hypothetical protein
MILIVCFFVARVLAVIDPSLKHCDHNRTEVLECVNHYAGAGSRGMCPEHIAELKSGVLNPLEKFLALFYTIEKVMTDCDTDRDGYISAKDCAGNAEFCVRKCSDVSLLYSVICKPARDMNFRPRKVKCFTDYDHRGKSY